MSLDNHFGGAPLSPSASMFGIHKVKRIEVISGHEFDLKLEDGRRIYGHLSIMTPREAKGRVVRLLNNVSNPRVVVKSRGNPEDVAFRTPTLWTIDIFLAVNGEEIMLSKWLKKQGLVLQ